MEYTNSISEPETGQIKLWPNPVVEELSVRSEKSVSLVEILDLTGKSQLKMIPSKTEFTVPMPGLKGMYFVRITVDSGETVMKKVVKY